MSAESNINPIIEAWMRARELASRDFNLSKQRELETQMQQERIKQQEAEFKRQLEYHKETTNATQALLKLQNLQSNDARIRHELITSARTPQQLQPSVPGMTVSGVPARQPMVNASGQMLAPGSPAIPERETPDTMSFPNPNYTDPMTGQVVENVATPEMFGQTQANIAGLKAAAEAQAQQPFRLKEIGEHLKGQKEIANIGATSRSEVAGIHNAYAMKLLEAKIDSAEKLSAERNQTMLAIQALKNQGQVDKVGQSGIDLNNPAASNIYKRLVNGTSSIEDIKTQLGPKGSAAFTTAMAENGHVPIDKARMVEMTGLKNVANNFSAFQKLAEMIDNYNPMSSKGPTIGQIKAQQQLVDGLLASVARAWGKEKGNLSNFDVARAKGYVPDLVRLPGQNQYKMTEMHKMLEDSINTLFEGYPAEQQALIRNTHFAHFGNKVAIGGKLMDADEVK
jgi:hypothetical protein